jgi:uncharacterized membrane protein YqaE (UPF0057 family)
MNSKSVYLLALLTIIVFGQSCTVQKCHYSKGFNVSFKKGASNLKSSIVSENHSGCANTSDNLQEESGVMDLNNSDNAEFASIVIPHSSHSDGVMSTDICGRVLEPLCNKGRSKVISSGKNEVCSKLNRRVKVVIQNSSAPLAPDWLILLLCIFIPPIAVALMSNGNIEKILIALLLWILGLLPGIVYAFLVFLHYL